MSRLRFAVLPVAVALALVACADVASPEPSVEPGSDSASASASVGAQIIDPGQPYTGDEILAAMRDSRRPGGVPDELETDAIAAGVADALWTFDGQPWAEFAIGGSCGFSCTLEVVGTRDDAEGEDLWTFEVSPETGDVALIESSLGATPDSLAAELDELARSLAPVGLLDGLLLASTRWHAPPDDGAFALAYRSGEEEGSCSIDIILDAIEPRIVLAGDPC